MHFCKDMHNSPTIVYLHARHTQMTLESLADVFQGRDWELRAQAALWVVAGSIILSAEDFPPVYIQRGCEAIDAAGLQFIPTYGRPPELSDALHEKLSILSQFIYFENFLFLTCGGAEPTLTARIEKEFRHQLQVRLTPSLSHGSRVQRFLKGHLSDVVQRLSIDHAHANHPTGQRHGGHT